MATVKSYTDLVQSKALTEILPVDSADMYYPNRKYIDCDYALPIKVKRGAPLLSQEIPCWSLAALLDVLPNKLNIALAIDNFKSDRRKEKYAIGSVENDNYDSFADNPIDACYEMILKLYKQNLL